MMTISFEDDLTVTSLPQPLQFFISVFMSEVITSWKVGWQLSALMKSVDALQEKMKNS